jgi:hypothetical protein
MSSYFIKLKCVYHDIVNSEHTLPGTACGASTFADPAPLTAQLDTLDLKDR